MKMKRLLRTPLLLLAFLLPMTAMAYDFVVDGVYYSTDLWGDYVMVSDQGEDGGHYSGNVVIPASVTHDGTTYPVTKINAYAFSNCTELTSVSLLNPVNEIGDHSFENCTSLSSIEIPDGVTLIGSAAFENSAITRLDLPASIAEIKIWAFQNCTSLSDVYSYIPDPSQIELGFNAFALEDENYSSRTLHVPTGTIQAYKDAGWGDFFGKIVEL